MSIFKMTKYGWFINSLIFICISLSPFHGKAEHSKAVDVIKTFNTTLLESMKRADEIGFSGRYKLLEPIIKNSFALCFMAKKSVGRYWKTLQETRRKLLLDTYTTWSVATYARRFDEYSGEKFEVLSETKSAHNTVTVISTLRKSNEETIDFYYKLREIKGEWRIVDIQISGISQLANTRAQFVSVIKDKGFDDLISRLQNKIKFLSEETAPVDNNG